MPANKIKLFYFDARGRGEVVRLALTLAGKEFEDVRFTRDEWPKYKADAPFGQAPYADIDGKKFGQSVALAAFVAREFGLYGKTSLDTLRIDEVIQLHGDLMGALLKSMQEKDEAKKAEIDKKLTEEDLPKFFDIFQKLLQQNGGTGVFVGKDLTLAELFVFDIMFSLNKMRNFDAAAKFPEVKKLKDKVESNPKLKAYLAKRKDTPF